MSGLFTGVYWIVRGVLSSVGWSVSNWLARRGL